MAGKLGLGKESEELHQRLQGLIMELDPTTPPEDVGDLALIVLQEMGAGLVEHLMDTPGELHASTHLFKQQLGNAICERLGRAFLL